MKKVIIVALMASCLFAISCNGTKKGAKGAEAQQDSTMTATCEEPVFDIVTNMGTMRIKLYSKTPKHRDNFVKLASENFYDSLLFHRVIDGFMIQGGDPLTRDSSNVSRFGTGGPGYTIPAEFVTEYYHKKGALAAARMGDFANPKKASSGSQFYIVQDEMNCLQLDGEYTVFGETIEGLDVIDKIASVPTDGRDMPLQPVVILSVKKVEETPLEAPADTVAVETPSEQ